MVVPEPSVDVDLFYFMDYQKIHDQIIDRAKKEYSQGLRTKKNGIYYEGHHIIPRCLGGIGWANNWNHENIVPLTAREHFIIHWILHLIYPNHRKLGEAFYNMCVIGKKQKRYIPSSRIIEYARILHGKNHSTYMKNNFWSEDMTLHMSKAHMGEKNWMYGKNHTDETIQKMKNIWTQEKKQSASQKFLGDNNPAKRLEVQIKMKQRALNRKKVNCPHCDKEGAINQMKQWHFENCKNKKD